MRGLNPCADISLKYLRGRMTWLAPPASQQFLRTLPRENVRRLHHEVELMSVQKVPLQRGHVYNAGARATLLHCLAQHSLQGCGRGNPGCLYSGWRPGDSRVTDRTRLFSITEQLRRNSLPCPKNETQPCKCVWCVCMLAAQSCWTLCDSCQAPLSMGFSRQEY